MHGAGVLLALAAALVWPRTGQAALMVPLAGGNATAVLHWAEHENAPLLALDTGRGRAVARIPSSHSLLAALGQGLLPIAVRDPGCGPHSQRSLSAWKS